MKFKQSLLLSIGVIATISAGVGYGVYYLISNNRDRNETRPPQWTLDSLTDKEQKLFRSIINYHEAMIHDYEGSKRFKKEIEELKNIFKNYATDENKKEALNGVPALPGKNATTMEKIKFIEKVWNAFEPQIQKLSLIQIDNNQNSYKSLTKSVSKNYNEVEQTAFDLLSVSWEVHSLFRDVHTKFKGEFANIKAFLSTKENEYLLRMFLLTINKKISDKWWIGKPEDIQAKLSKLNTQDEMVVKFDWEMDLYMFIDVYSTIFNES